jgi:hypothetical protein
MEILRFSASRFYIISETLTNLEHIVDEGSSDAVDENTRKNMLTGLLVLKNCCEAIGLSMSIKSVDRLFTIGRQCNTLGELKGTFRELSTRIKDEIEDNLFLYIPKTHVKFYNTDQLFGAEVQEAFPSTAYDIQEAGKCLALHRNTAAVCHLMRTLEIGLRVLAIALKVKFENKPWNYVIEVADKRLSKTRGQNRKPRNWKANEKFYSEAIAHFRFLKDAWRNYSMHVYERYDEDQAEGIFTHTKAFMRELATKLKEAP